MGLRNTENRWGWFSIGIHWLTAIAVISLFVLGLWMVELTYYDEWYRRAPQLHKSFGMILLLLSLIRMLWNRKNITPRPPTGHSVFEHRVAPWIHKSLYLLLFLVMFSGYLISTADGRGIEVFGLFEVPALVYGIDKQEDIAGYVHLVLAIILISLVSLHALAAIKHHLVDKDLTLKRMLGMS